MLLACLFKFQTDYIVVVVVVVVVGSQHLRLLTFMPAHSPGPPAYCSNQNSGIQKVGNCFFAFPLLLCRLNLRLEPSSASFIRRLGPGPVISGCNHLRLLSFKGTAHKASAAGFHTGPGPVISGAALRLQQS
jgi:hypothetical protein